MKHRIESCCSELEAALTSLYEMSFIPAAVRPHYRRDGTRDQWALDLRIGLSCHSILQPIARKMGQLILSHGVAQVVGSGYGSAFLLGGLIATNPELRGGIMRDAAKPHGFRRLIEGSVQSDQPVFLIDDVLSSGRSAAASLDVLHEQGFRVAGLVTVFRYDWRNPEENLKRYEIRILSLATLFRNPAEGNGPTMEA